MVHMAVTVPVTVNGEVAVAAPASGVHAAMANRAARHTAPVRRQDFPRRSIIGDPPSFGSQIMGPTSLQSSDWLSKLGGSPMRSEEHTSELQSRPHLVCRLLLEKKKK